MGVSAGVGEESEDRLLCRRVALEAHGGHHGRPAQKLRVSRLLRVRVLATVVGTHPRGGGRGHRRNEEEEASELRLFRRSSSWMPGLGFFFVFYLD